MKKLDMAFWFTGFSLLTGLMTSLAVLVGTAVMNWIPNWADVAGLSFVGLFVLLFVAAIVYGE